MPVTNKTDFEQEVLALIGTLDNSEVHQFFNSEVDERWTPDILDQFAEQKIEVKAIDSYGGEDQGSDYWSIYEFKRGDSYAYVKFDGWYASYHGSEFTEAFIVRPTQKLVTVYE